MTAKGYALCVGLNALDPAHYDGWNGQLNACEADAISMTTVLANHGLSVHQLLTQHATRAKVLGCLRRLVALAVAGDLIVFTNSSHGGQVPDTTSDEVDGMDETICMFDGQIIDDELANIWAAASAGVRIMMISDSCHSGTVVRAFSAPHKYGSRAMPAPIAEGTYQRNKAFYDGLARGNVHIGASVLALGACQDNQTAMDGRVNGLFTGTLLSVLKGYPTASAGSVIARCRREMPSDQSPKYTYVGTRMSTFEKSTLFKI